MRDFPFASGNPQLMLGKHAGFVFAEDVAFKVSFCSASATELLVLANATGTFEAVLLCNRLYDRMGRSFAQIIRKHVTHRELLKENTWQNIALSRYSHWATADWASA
jgi:hypothetical protein